MTLFFFYALESVQEVNIILLFETKVVQWKLDLRKPDLLKKESRFKKDCGNEFVENNQLEERLLLQPIF